MENKEDNALIFLDQSKAFDRIYHKVLKHKLKSIGLTGTLFELLSNYLNNRKIRVVLDGSKLQWMNITAGVPQGSILGPLLFIIYINDIVNELETYIHLYADDAERII